MIFLRDEGENEFSPILKNIYLILGQIKYSWEWGTIEDLRKEILVECDQGIMAFIMDIHGWKLLNHVCLSF